MNGTIARITARGLLGQRRLLLLLALPATLIALAVVLRIFDGGDQTGALLLLQRYGLATLLPLVALIASTAVIGPELDDGTIVFVLATPVSRPVVVRTKLAIATAATLLFAAVPVLAATLLLTGNDDNLAVAFTVGAAAGAIAYSAVFVLIQLAVRHGVVVGLVYALLWESVIGGFVPGARELSIQQWMVSITDALAATHPLHPSVSTAAALVLLPAVSIAATLVAGRRLAAFTLKGEG